MMDVRKQSPSQMFLFLSTIGLIVVILYGLFSLTEKLRLQFSRVPQPMVVIDTAPGSQLKVTATVVETACENDTQIEYSFVDVFISDGFPPYELTIINSHSQISGPYTINNNSPARIKVYGGDFFTAQVSSIDGKNWAGTITLPAKDEFCKVPATFTPPSYFTDTPLPTTTEIVIVYATDTADEHSSIETSTKKPATATSPVNIIHSPTNTNSVPVQITNTSHLPQWTDTPQPPQWTDTPQPPKATDTPLPPPPTYTPIIPNPRNCEDGIDNDGDGKTDYPADPDCKKPSDPHEDK